MEDGGHVEAEAEDLMEDWLWPEGPAATPVQCATISSSCDGVCSVLQSCLLSVLNITLLGRNLC